MGKRTGKPRGRPKGVKSKRTIGTDAFLARGGLSQPQPEFSALEHLENLAKLSLDPLYKELKKEKPDVEKIKALTNDARVVLRDLAPYKHPRLASIKVDGTMKWNLDTLSDNELAFLRRVREKAAGADTD